MYIVVVGAGAVGRSIARELVAHGHDVTIIDSKPAKLQVAQLADADWILADACDPDTLEEARASSCDVMVAATGDDKTNLVISLLAKTEFAVPRTVARVNNPVNEWMFDEAWGVDMAVSTPRIMTSLVEEVVAEGQPVHLFRFHGSGASLYSVRVPAASPAIGQRIPELKLPRGVVLAAVLRDAHAFIPNHDSTVEQDDEILTLLPPSSQDVLDQMAQIFQVASAAPEDLAQED